MSLMTLLDQEGYLLQRVDGAYDMDILKDVPDDICLADANVAAPTFEDLSSAGSFTFYTLGFALSVLIAMLNV